MLILARTAFQTDTPSLSLKTGQCRVLRHSDGGGRFILFSFEIEVIAEELNKLNNCSIDPRISRCESGSLASLAPGMIKRKRLIDGKSPVVAKERLMATEGLHASILAPTPSGRIHPRASQYQHPARPLGGIYRCATLRLHADDGLGELAWTESFLLSRAN